MQNNQTIKCPLCPMLRTIVGNATDFEYMFDHILVQHRDFDKPSEMNEIEKFNIIECIIDSDIFEMPRKMMLIDALVTLRRNG